MVEIAGERKDVIGETCGRDALVGSPSAILLTAVTVAMTIFHLSAAGVILLPSFWQYAIHLAFGFAVAFLAHPLDPRGGMSARLLDTVLIALGVGAIVFLLWRYDDMVQRVGLFRPEETVAAIVVVAVTLEYARRIIGWALPVLGLVSLIYAFLGPWFPEPFAHRGYDIERIATQLVMTTAGIFGIPLAVAATLVSLFVIFGAFLEVTGCGRWFIELANTFAGRRPGGPAKVAVLASGLMGSISGSAAGNVVTTGTFTIPLMKSAGYRSVFAGATEAAASTGGLIMPPLMGAGAFIMAQFLGIGYGEVAVAALVPAILYYLAIWMQVHFEARRLGLGASRQEDTPPLRRTLARWPYALPLLVLIHFVLVERRSPEFAAFWSLGSAVLIGLLLPTPLRSVGGFVAALRKAGLSLLPVSAACAAAGVVTGVLILTGLGLRMASIMVDLADGNLPVLLVLTMISSLILGMGLPATPAYIILAVLAAPALIQVGVDPLAAHMFVFYFGMVSNITPPVAVAAFAAAGLSGDSPHRVGVTAFRLGSVAFLIPFMFVYGPQLLLLGSSPWLIALSLATSTIGTVCLAAALQGWLLVRTHVWERVALLVAALSLVKVGGLTDLAGFALLAAVYLAQHSRQRRTVERGADDPVPGAP